MADFEATKLGRYAGTHHLTSNYAISVEGEVATARAYLISVHIFDAADPTRHADGAGWYNCRLRRTADGWRLTEVALQASYLSGEMMLPALTAMSCAHGPRGRGPGYRRGHQHPDTVDLRRV